MSGEPDGDPFGPLGPAKPRTGPGNGMEGNPAGAVPAGGEGDADAAARVPAPTRRTGPWVALVGLAFLALVVFAIVSSATDDEGGLLGVGELQAGVALAEFAVPDIQGDLVGDANVFQDDCETAANPCPADEQRTPACEVEGAGVINACVLFRRPSAISFWFTRGGDCLASQDAFAAVAERYGGRVNFLSVNVRDELDDVRSIVAERGWTLPVGWDRDGALSNLYRIGGCPTVALAYPGGILDRALIGAGSVTEDGLENAIRELLAESAARAEVLR